MARVGWWHPVRHHPALKGQNEARWAGVASGLTAKSSLLIPAGVSAFLSHLPEAVTSHGALESHGPPAGVVLAKGRGGSQEEPPGLAAVPAYDSLRVVTALPAHGALFLPPVQVEAHLHSGVSALRSQATDRQNVFCIIQIF